MSVTGRPDGSTTRPPSDSPCPARTISFAGQPLFPPGIDLEEQLERNDAERQRGPWFDLYVYDTKNVCTEGPGASRGGNRRYLNQSGIVWFPGSVPLYRDGILIGGLGISGDGVEQDDLVSFSGGEAAPGFEPPASIRADQVFVRGVRLPYLKFNRRPEQ